MMRRIAHWLALDRSDPSELISGLSIMLLGVWLILPYSESFLAAQNWALVNRIAPLPMWGLGCLAMGIMQWLAVVRQWKHVRITNVWLIMMLRLFLLLLLSSQTNGRSVAVPDFIAYVVLAIMAYLRLRL